MLLYLGFVLVAVVFTAMFACVVLGQLILAELLELVSHCLLQAHWQRAVEALETDKHCENWTDLTELICLDSTRRETLSLCYRS